MSSTVATRQHGGGVLSSTLLGGALLGGGELVMREGETIDVMGCSRC